MAIILTATDFTLKKKVYDPELSHIFRYQPAHYELATFEHGWFRFYVMRHDTDPDYMDQTQPTVTYRLNTTFKGEPIYGSSSTDGSYTYEEPATTPFSGVFERLIEPSLMGDVEQFELA